MDLCDVANILVRQYLGFGVDLGPPLLTRRPRQRIGQYTSFRRFLSTAIDVDDECGLGSVEATRSGIELAGFKMDLSACCEQVLRREVCAPEADD